MKLGFTGTQSGMSERQKEKFERHLVKWRDSIVEFHHGDCVGADEQAHKLVLMVIPECRIVIHRGTNAEKTAFCCGGQVVTKPVRPGVHPNISRNRDIVDAVDFMIATPYREEKSQPRSGTWSTIRYTRKVGKPIDVLT